MSHRAVRPVGPILVLAVLVLALFPSGAGAAVFGSRTLRQGMVGSDVASLQRVLSNLGEDTHIDGHYGPGTARSVRAWETWTRIRVDGVVSRADARRLLRQLRAGLRVPAGDDAEAFDSGGSVAPDPSVAPPTGRAALTSAGLAVAPADAPPVVQAIINAGNEIAYKPYRYGGGHGNWQDSGYDCSGSVSYALHGASLLDAPLTSGQLAGFGASGPGRWVTIYANSGHVFMVVAGLRFDTSGRSGGKGSRWQSAMRTTAAFVARHPQGT